MVWFKVDDHLPQHRKVLSIPRKQRLAAIGLWTLAGAWCGQQGTDGAVPEYLVEELGGSKAQAAVLVAAGLWEVTETGWLFHDWQQANPTAEQTETKRDQWRDRQRKSRANRKSVTRDNDVTGSDVTPIVTRESTSPDPTRPEPLPNSGGSVTLSTVDVGNRATANTLVGEYLTAVQQRRAPKPPRAVVGALVDHATQMLHDGTTPEVIRTALTRWHDLGLGAGALPSVVHEVQTPRRRPPSGAVNGFDPQAAMAAARELEAQG